MPPGRLPLLPSTNERSELGTLSLNEMIVSTYLLVSRSLSDEPLEETISEVVIKEAPVVFIYLFVK
jgi:hypothetical protein